MSESTVNNDLYTCPKCGRTFSKAFPDCVFCDMRYTVVKK